MKKTSPYQARVKSACLEYRGWDYERQAASQTNDVTVRFTLENRRFIHRPRRGASTRWSRCVASSCLPVVSVFRLRTENGRFGDLNPPLARTGHRMNWWRVVKKEKFRKADR